ncbi:MAG: glycogen debranching protein [Desulfobacteraceae bacterium 4572_123]|nr:MAG: glycogen debranching protein [Desulfobacteraceae bacterium 4572_123]
MNHDTTVTQHPSPGKRLLMFRGDTLCFTLDVPDSKSGRAWLRTNIGAAAVARKEVIDQVRFAKPALGRDWFDIPMMRADDHRFRITLPLIETGHFEAKAFFLEQDTEKPIWPAGPNTGINVEPADTCCANIIYNAFVRQFGPNKSGSFKKKVPLSMLEELDNAGYTVIPPSGTFRDLIRHLDFIFEKLGCRGIQLLPIHPTPTTYARMGRFGSPYAALNFTEVDPALAEFDPQATPLEQFIELVDAVHARNGKLLLDVAINHTGWAASLHGTHPQWLVRDQKGRIEVPGAWGVNWEDLTRLDYTHQELWQYMAAMFLTWCRRGVDGFRCDAGYMIPVPAWTFIVATVREQYPDTVFMLEGLGGKISTTRRILNRAGFNWAYSELFQNYDRVQIENYLPEALDISRSDGLMIHFAETHDNLRLAARSHTWAKMRTALCALLSVRGGFAFANGVEWYATEKLNVHEATSLNWDAPVNQIEHIQRLNCLLKIHPAFHDRCEITLPEHKSGNCLAVLRKHQPTGKALVILVNLDDKYPIDCTWAHQEPDPRAPLWDLISGEKITVAATDTQHTYHLAPGRVLCLTSDKSEVDRLCKAMAAPPELPSRIIEQRLQAKVWSVFCFYNGIIDTGPFNPVSAARRLVQNPLDFCRSLNPSAGQPGVVVWQYPRDLHRQVMVPPDHFLLIRAENSFQARIMRKQTCLRQEESLACGDGSWFVLFTPRKAPKTHQDLILHLALYANGVCNHKQAHVLFLSAARHARIQHIFKRKELLGGQLLFLGTNGRGAMLRANAAWAELNSRYDALLAANLNPEFPEDRWIMFTRCRAWVVFQDYSQELGNDCIDTFYFKNHTSGIWHFTVPAGQGEHIGISIQAEMIPGHNAVHLCFCRDRADGQNGYLGDAKPVQLILRPDIESRNFHAVTKAYLGPEQDWPPTVTPMPNGFIFTPRHDRALSLTTSRGSFIPEPEWHYSIRHPMEADRGLDPDSDLFSPGYFSCTVKGGKTITLSAKITAGRDRASAEPPIPPNNVIPALPAEDPKADMVCFLKDALEQYIVKRHDLATVIAGYPWFLDWGRDTLIVLRGMISAGWTKKAFMILKQFAIFEENGTLPNMIHGQNSANRDTSDAPLWFFIDCADLAEKQGGLDFLETMCGNRTLRQILIDMGQSLIKGTPNGIHMDSTSGLIFSPAHFTWMDTNHPAGTPREGYPIEIQALWHAAICFLARIDTKQHKARWRKRADLVRSSIRRHFVLDTGYLSDCLHAKPGQGPGQAAVDDALRPNQLFAVTLGAINDKAIGRDILSACETLLVPGAIRSLADQPLRHPLPIIHQGRPVNDPHHPYQGKYSGDEDTQRKPAYHNGTAWTWIFPSFCEAWARVYGAEAAQTALSWLSGSTETINRGCIGQVPEITDGDFPHTRRGCDAQAWGVSELLRVWIKLK